MLGELLTTIRERNDGELNAESHFAYGRIVRQLPPDRRAEARKKLAEADAVGGDRRATRARGKVEGAGSKGVHSVGAPLELAADVDRHRADRARASLGWLVHGLWHGSVLSQFARMLGKPVVALETVDTQRQALTGGPAAEPLLALEASISSLEQDRVRPEVRTLVQAWSDGDLATLDNYGRSDAKAYLDPTVFARNQGLAEAVDRLHQQGKRVFAAAGILHMTGDQGLPKRLEKLGDQVERVPFEGAKSDGAARDPPRRDGGAPAARPRSAALQRVDVVAGEHRLRHAGSAPSPERTTPRASGAGRESPPLTPGRERRVQTMAVYVA